MTMTPTSINPLIGISSCLLGEAVRYDGGHKRDSWISEQLSGHVEFRMICPEAGAGLGVPRPPMRLMGDVEAPRAVLVKDASVDLTGSLVDFSQRQVGALDDLCGYILKSRSPSCGMERVKVFQENGRVLHKGVGLFAARLLARYPLLPVEEEGRLNDAVLRENFINRVYVYQRWKQLKQEGATAAGLIEFHSRHKYMLMAHSQAAYKRMGRMLSDLKGRVPELVADAYFDALMTALRRRASRARHVNVLMHIMGYLKKRIDREDKEELLNSAESYRRGEVGLVVPVTLLRHYFRRNHDLYIEKQYYLYPYPDALGLRGNI
jgi:uncharacterized protein YbgA (DUF1722 family)/uncharacterized protein YbbK (DUF523 family)